MPLRQVLLSLRARFHLWTGRRAYRAGHFGRAHRHLGTAVACGRGDFATYLLLGKIAYRERDLRRAADFFQKALCSDPARYALEGFPEDFITKLRQQPELSARTTYRVLIEAETQPRRTKVAAVQAGTPQRSLSEQRRLSTQPKLEPGAGAEIDWDAEAGKLFERD